MQQEIDDGLEQQQAKKQTDTEMNKESKQHVSEQAGSIDEDTEPDDWGDFVE